MFMDECESRPMVHPLVRIAQEYDIEAQAANGYSLADLLENLLSKDKHDEAVSTYAAHISVLTQDVQLGSANIHEEPQTSALFGLLASSFWHASILDNLASEAEKEVGYEDEQSDYHAKRQWIYQDKRQESEYGFDFGIATSLPDNKVKITVFQAKRPATEEHYNNISLGHRVREQSGLNLPVNRNQLSLDIKSVRKSIKNNASIIPPKRLRHLQNTLADLTYIYKNRDELALPLAQKESLNNIIGIIKEKDSLYDAIEEMCTCQTNIAIATYHGDDSMFSARFSYYQYEAFLSLAIGGWTHDHRSPNAPNWCHYVQWLNGANGPSWSTPLQSALKTSGRMDDSHRTFASTLSSALSPSDQTIGLILPRNHARAFAAILLDKSPNLTWGVTADTHRLAHELLIELGCPPNQVMQPLRAAHIADQQSHHGQDDDNEPGLDDGLEI